MDILNTLANLVHQFIGFFRDLLPGGWGLILIPLGLLAIISLWFGLRNR